MRSQQPRGVSALVLQPVRQPALFELRSGVRFTPVKQILAACRSRVRAPRRRSRAARRRTGRPALVFGIAKYVQFRGARAALAPGSCV
jgi:hypothetical protein